MTAPLTRSDLEAAWSQAEVSRWANKRTEDGRTADQNVTDAISDGWGEVRSALLNRFPAEAIDALAPETLPSLARAHTVALSVDWLSRGSQPREEIEKQADAARLWLALIVTGKDHTFDSVLTPPTSSTGTSSARIGKPTFNAFDTEDPTSPYRQRVQRI